jgi:acyl carrier protein
MNERIKEVMAKAFGLPEDQITEQSSMDNIENWDSIHHVQMIVFLEREFDIEIPDESVGKMINFELIKAVIDGCAKT